MRPTFPRLTLLLSAVVSAALAQAPGADNGKDETVVLNPFEVTTKQDNSYGALQSNSLSAFKMDLQKMPATAQVFTSQFIEDTNSMTVEDMLLNYAGTVGFAPGDTSAFTESSGDRDGGGGLSIRGFGNGGGIKFDGFFGPPSSRRSASGDTPTFMIDRVEVIEGPQSMLYGAIGAGGVINAVYKQAQFGQNTAKADYRIDDYGSKFGHFDYNVGTDHVALRMALADESASTDRQNLGASTKGIYLQGAVRLGPSTVIRILHSKYDTEAWNGFNPSIKPFLPATSPVLNNTTQWLAAHNDIPAAAFNGGNIDWNNVESFGGVWTMEPSSIRTTNLEVETTLLPWLSAKMVAIYNEYNDWRNTTTLTLEPAGVAGNPYPYSAIQLSSPNLNFQSQRQKGVQLNLLATNDLFGGRIHSQTVLGGYVQHIGPSFGSSGISYNWFAADNNWNPIIGGPGAASNGSDYGRTLMGAQWIPVVNGQITKYGVFDPRQSRVTLNGQNYVLLPRIIQSAAYKGFAIPGPGVQSNPYGLVPNGSANLTNTAPGGNFTFNGSFNPGTEEHEHYLDFGNYTDWFGGRFTTLIGASFDRAISENVGATNASFLPWTTYTGYEVGAIYQILPVLGAYATLSTAATPAGSTHDLFGNSLAPPDAKSPVPEFGLKAHSRDQRYSAQLAWDISTKDTNELQSVDASYQNAVNPSGINALLPSGQGRFGGAATNNFVNVDRTATALEFTATADPTPNFRLRANITYNFTRVTDNVIYPQLYNDQFHANSAGQVTYANGNLLYVNGSATGAATANIVGSTTAGATPLTIAMLNTPSNPYYASPDPVSGSITNTALRTILSTGGGSGSVGAQQVAANGTASTQVVGLPLSQIQYNFTSPFPNNQVPVFLAGNPTTGNYGWQWNVEGNYTLSEGPLTGLGAFVAARVQYSTRVNYTFYPSSNASLGSAATNQVNEGRVIVVLPPISDVNVGINYQRKFKRLLWHTSLTVSDLFNHDRFYDVPQVGNGTLLQNTQRVAPRTYSWSNSVAF